mgnify:CR=1 FL=1
MNDKIIQRLKGYDNQFLWLSKTKSKDLMKKRTDRMIKCIDRDNKLLKITI